MQKKELFENLALGHAERITVVTPNRRLSQALVADFDAYQAAQGRTVWEAADILPVGAFVERLYEDALYSDLKTELPMLLTQAQEQLLWAEAIQTRSGSELLALQQTAEQCRKAWKLVHEWRIGIGAGNEDALAFNAWSSKYKDLTKGEIDSARLPDLVLGFINKLDETKKAKLLVAYGFDLVPPQTKEFLAAFELAECQPEAKKGASTRISFSSRKEELDQAAAWARARLEANPQARIGVVVPELESRRAEVVRVFSRTLQPGFNLPGAAKAPMPFNVSLGLPLFRYPVVALALSIIEFSSYDLEFEKVSNLILSPFIAGAESELAARAKLDVRLRRKLDASVSLAKLIANVEGAPLLRRALEKIFDAREKNPQTPSAWARHFSALLDAAGFPGERGLDSEEFQARAKLHEVLGELARLERISSKISFLQALSTLKRLTEETLFQPETQGEAPIQVLGVLESAGLELDHLWVSGLTDEAWPLRAQANPFVPVALQKQAGIPQASAESSLALDRRITEGWARAADEVVFSFFDKDQDRDLAPSPLILGFPEAAVSIPSFPRLRDLIFSSKKTSTVADSVGPAVTATQVRGGTRVLSDQAACPFRAFGHWRLSAQEMETPSEGLDASDRGRLLHSLMSSLWGLLKDSKSLQNDIAPAIDAAAAAAVKDLGLEGRFADLERARLVRLAREWLEVEKARPPFEVVALEEKRTLSFAGLEFEARIDRMDRVKEGHVLIDYKTSANPTPNNWKPPRPHDPQLPLYAVSAKEEVAAVAFAKVRHGEMRFLGFSKEENLLDGVRKAKAWNPLLQSWKDEAEALGKGFASGEAQVDPKRGLAVTCRFCDLHTLCRVYEKVNVLAEDEPESEDGE
jgi:ATP-dependent helicase/nuclease subunit B